MTTTTETTYLIEVPARLNYLVSVEGAEGLTKEEVLELMKKTPTPKLQIDLDSSTLRDALRVSDWNELYVSDEEGEELN